LRQVLFRHLILLCVCLLDRQRFNHSLRMFAHQMARQCRYQYSCKLRNGFAVARHNVAYLAVNKRTRTSSASSRAVYYEEMQHIVSLVWRIMAFSGIAYSVSEYGFELTLCEGPSMLPTIKSSGEIILVDRISARLHGIEGGAVGTDRIRFARKRQEDHENSISSSSSEEKEYRWHQPIVPVTDLPISEKWHRLWKQTTSGISVGDVVVVQHPDRKGTICKRVLGLPGDTVVKPPITMRRRRKQRRDLHERNGLLVIPDGHIWVEGDNSMNSADSRNYGSIPAAMIVGRVLLRVWPVRGDAMMQRGGRPIPVEGAPFSGSTILPAGYEGEGILKD